MNNRQPKNIDGFALRRRPAQSPHPGRLGTDKLAVPDRFLRENRDTSQVLQPANPELSLPRPATHSSISKSELDASLREIDDSKGSQKSTKPHWLTKKRLKRIFLSLILLVVLAGVILGIQFLIASGKVFNGNLFDLFGQGKELKMDAGGRTNMLLFGNSEDSVAHQEVGSGELTDSIMVISLDQKTKNVVMFSVPRDLWVKYGKACNSGYEGRINEVYLCGKDGASEKEGAQKLMGIVGDTFDLEMHYYVQVNYTALKEAVNAVGGITVEIDSDDPRGILDRNFDWQCNYNCNLVKWPNGPATLNGEQALALARARNAAGGYGLAGGNFDREHYQQRIIVALKEKASSSGTLANPVAVSGLISTLGNNVRSSFDASEIKTLVTLAGEIRPDSIKQLSLVNPNDPALTTGNVNGASIVRPVAGLYDFTEVRAFLKRNFTNNVTASEDADIEVLNGTDTSGVAGKKAQELSVKGIIVSSTGDAPTSSSYGALKWFDLTDGSKTQTKQKLTDVLGEPDSGSTLPEGVQSSADFVIIVGNGAN